MCRGCKCIAIKLRAMSKGGFVHFSTEFDSKLCENARDETEKCPHLDVACVVMLNDDTLRLATAILQFMDRLVRNLSDAIELMFVCNNASWAIGEIANAADKEVSARFCSTICPGCGKYPA